MAWVDAYSVKAMIQNSGYDLEYREDREAMCREVDELPAVDAIPIQQAASIIAGIMGCPCNYSPLDEQMYKYCGEDCHMHDVDCWERVFRMKMEG